MIDVVEAAYRSPSRDHQRWLAEVVRATQPHLDHGLGTFGFLIDARRSLDSWVGPPVMGKVPRGFPSAVRCFLKDGFARMPRDLVDAAFRKPAPRVAAGSELAGGTPLTNVPFIADFARRFGFADSIGVRCGNPIGLGCFIGAFTPAVVRTSAQFRRCWSAVAAHLTAAIRLRDADAPVEDASFRANGVPIHVAHRAIDHVAQLRAAIANRARSRSRRLRTHAGEAL